MVLSLILLVFALVMFIVAGFVAVPEPWHNRLVCFGLACLAGAMLFEKAGPLLAR
jgi:hypothetical protein